MKELAGPLFYLAVLLAIVYAVAPFLNLGAEVQGWIMVVQLVIGIIVGFAIKHEKERASLYAPLAAYAILTVAFTGTTPAQALVPVWQLVANFLVAFIPVFVATVAIPVLIKDVPEALKA